MDADRQVGFSVSFLCSPMDLMPSALLFRQEQRRERSGKGNGGIHVHKCVYTSPACAGARWGCKLQVARVVGARFDLRYEIHLRAYQQLQGSDSDAI